MNIWTQDPKNTDNSLRSPIEDYEPKSTTFQTIIEEALANSIYAWIAWSHHKNEHMFSSAIHNQFFVPLQKIMFTYTFPSVVEINTTDLKYFKMHAKEFKRALKKINEVLINRAHAQPTGMVMYGPVDPVVTVEILVLY